MHKTLRKLWIADAKALRAHLKRLDPEARRLRFGGVSADEFIDAYVDTAFRLDAMIFGIFMDGEIRASAELRSIFGGATPDAEAAFAVEAEWQDQGFGSELMDRILTAAQKSRRCPPPYDLPQRECPDAPHRRQVWRAPHFRRRRGDGRGFACRPDSLVAAR